MFGRALNRYLFAYTPSIKFVGKRTGGSHEYPSSASQPAQKQASPQQSSVKQALDMSKLQPIGKPQASAFLTEKQINLFNEGGQFQLNYLKVKPINLKK